MAVVSIVLPTYDRLDYLRAAVACVFEQTFTDWELLIADDGSDKTTRRYLQGLCGDSRVRVFLLSHTGRPGVARNVALRAATGNHVAFLDSDDLWRPTKLAAQLSSLDESLTGSEDYDLWLRLARRSDIDAVREPLTLVRRHAHHFSGDAIGGLLGSRAVVEKIMRFEGIDHLKTSLARARAEIAARLAHSCATAGRARLAASRG